MASALTNRAWVSDIRGVPTVQLLLEYLQLWEVLQNVQLEDRAPDTVCLCLTEDQASSYGAMFIGSG